MTPSSGRLAFGLYPRLAVDADREDEGAYPDRDDEHVDQCGENAGYADGFDEDVFMLVTGMTPPAAVPRMRAGRMRDICRRRRAPL